MEIVLSGIAGALAAACVFGLTGLVGESEGEQGGTCGGALTDARAAARELGALVCASGLVPARAMEELSAQMRVELAARAPAAGRAGDDEMLGMLALGCIGCALAGTLLVGVFPGALVGVAALPAALRIRSGRRRRSEERRVEETMPEAFNSLALSLGSGLSLSQAMRYVGSRTAEPVGSAFMRVSFAVGCGVPAARALDSMIDELRAPGLELVGLALKVSQRTGAPLKDVLGEAAKLVGSRIELARRLDVKTSQARMSAQLVALMPAVMLLFLALFSSDFQRGLLTVPGACSVAVALALNAAAWGIIRRIMKVRL